ncbi:phosphoglycolate phosphatase [Polymorphobacter sp.]|uniref:phosphoglycolate phosphatase n=1 Tax=Polymorphobacter sp. TaxID=1909290 RepID=UPI003F6F895E
MNPYPSCIVFDLDGTLVDSAPDLCAALNHALGALGRPPVPADEVRHMVGHGARALLGRGLARSGEATPELVEAGVPPFMAYYRDHIADGSRPFDGVETALDALAAAGSVLAVCTNKPQVLADALIAALGWTARFAAVVGFDSVPRAKPDAGHVMATLATAGAAAEADTAVFVGDSITDVSAARNAGLPVVVVSFGFSDRPAADLGADVVIDHYDQLLPALARMNVAAR